MRHGEPGDPPSYPEERGPCPDCGERPCVCDEIRCEEIEEGGEA